ncbi:hypothetical protein Micbo1qcDRAFT_165213 [Microdochium bolleyi]|uniref:Uncharacterized protein n=1 Tax=Microdochium bolleyi TaxID=196109 RepID=A0A136IYK7_9PEZI|nr:hypothetical protein Micbo1qcDRAFT_165213 [Microdochium bolleyi]
MVLTLLPLPWALPPLSRSRVVPVTTPLLPSAALLPPSLSRAALTATLLPLLRASPRLSPSRVVLRAASPPFLLTAACRFPSWVPLPHSPSVALLLSTPPSPPRLVVPAPAPARTLPPVSALPAAATASARPAPLPSASPPPSPPAVPSPRVPRSRSPALAP